MQITSDEMLFFNDYDQEQCNSGGEHTNFLLKSIQIFDTVLTNDQVAALEDEYPVPGEVGACGTEPVAVYDMSTGTLASSATCGNGAPDLVDVGEHCDQDQVFVEDDLAALSVKRCLC